MKHKVSVHYLTKIQFIIFFASKLNYLLV